MPTLPATTIRGPKLLLVCATVIVTLAGVAAWQMLAGKPRAGAYIDVLALDGGFVVGLREETTSQRAFVELVGLDEGMRWQALVPGYQVPEGAIGVAAAEHAVTIRFPRDGHTQLFGFASQSARKLGSIALGHDLPREPDGHAASRVASFSGGAQSIEILEPDGGPARVYAIALSKGSVEWQHDLPGGQVDKVWVTAGQVIVAQPGTVSTIERETGAGQSRRSTRVCVIPGAAGRSDEILEAALCGRRGERILTDETIAPWLGGELVVEVPAAAPGSIPFAGELDRFVPVLVAGGDAAWVAGLDVDAGGEAWRSAANPALRGTQLVDAGPVVLIRVGDVLLSIDRATGAARAVRVPDSKPLRAHHVAGGLVWIVGPRGLAALDAATLAVRGGWRGRPKVLPASEMVTELGFKASKSLN